MAKANDAAGGGNARAAKHEQSGGSKPAAPQGRRSIGGQLAMLNNAIRRQIESRESSDIIRLSMANGNILVYLRMHDGEEVFQKDIENDFGVTRSTTSKILGLMEAKGLIKRESVERDARLKKISLTGQGRDALSCILAGREMMEAKLTEGFSPEERERLIDYLTRMKENIDGWQKGECGE